MIPRIAWKNILHRPLNALLSWVLLTTGVGIIAILLLLQEQIEQQMEKSIAGVDMVLGAKGSAMQLILSAVYHLDSPTGNINYQEAQRWMKHPFVGEAIPLSYGDSYKGFSILGTTTAYLDKYEVQPASGEVFKADFEVVVGANAARLLSLKVGDTFLGTHGLAEEGEKHESHPYIVTGVLAPSGTVADNLIIGNLESVWAMHHETGDEEGHTEVMPDSSREITAALIKFKAKMGFIQWPRMVAETTKMQCASPVIETNRLFSLFGTGIRGMQYAGWGIIFLAGLSVFIALYSTLKERIYEMALMRTLGASRLQLAMLVVLESLWLCLAGYVSGLVLSRVGLWIISKIIENEYHYAIPVLHFRWPQEGYLFLLTMACGLLAAMVPAWNVYRLNIAKTLAER